MADFWRDLVLTAMRNMSVTLGTVLPSILAMLTLVVLGAVLGWIAGALVGRLARAMDLDQRSRTWGGTAALARAGGCRAPAAARRRAAAVAAWSPSPSASCSAVSSWRLPWPSASAVATWPAKSSSAAIAASAKPRRKTPSLTSNCRQGGAAGVGGSTHQPPRPDCRRRLARHHR